MCGIYIALLEYVGTASIRAPTAPCAVPIHPVDNTESYPVGLGGTSTIITCPVIPHVYEAPSLIASSSVVDVDGKTHDLKRSKIRLFCSMPTPDMER